MVKYENKNRITLSTSIEAKILEDYVQHHRSGDRIPTEKELSSGYGVSITTIRRAVSALENSGKVVRRHGSGTFVVNGNVNYSVALLVPEVAFGDFYQRLAFSLEQDLRTHGIDSRIYVANAEHIPLSSMHASLCQHDAIILCGYGASTEELDSLGKPYLVAGCETSVDAPYIGFDFLSVMRQIVKHLVVTGCKDIRLLLHSLRPGKGLTKAEEMNMRIFSFQLALQEFGIPYNENMVYSVGATVPEYRTSISQIFSQARPDALICSNDLIALNACQVLQEMKIQVPSDVSIVGCNNLIPVEQQQIPLTTVDFCFNEVACQTSRLLDAIVSNRESERMVSSFIRPELVLRETTRPIPAKD